MNLINNLTEKIEGFVVLFVIQKLIDVEHRVYSICWEPTNGFLMQILIRNTSVQIEMSVWCDMTHYMHVGNMGIHETTRVTLIVHVFLSTTLKITFFITEYK